MCLSWNVRVRGLRILKIKEFTWVNDCFQKERNEEIGLYRQTLNKDFYDSRTSSPIFEVQFLDKI